MLETPILTIPFYDDLAKLILLWCVWALALVFQAVSALPALLLLLSTVFFVAVMLFIGVVLFASKLITVLALY